MSESEDQLRGRLDKEKIEIHGAIVNLMQAWAGIENMLATVIAATIGPMEHGVGGGDDLPLASAIIFSLAGLDARIAVTRRCFETFAGRMPKDEITIELANRIFAKLGRKRTLRNEVMHGAISTVATPGSQHLRLTPPTFNFGRLKVSDLSKRGLDANDINKAAESLGRFHLALPELAALIHAWREDDMPTYEQILQRLHVQFPQTHQTQTHPSTGSQHLP